MFEIILQLAKSLLPVSIIPESVTFQNWYAGDGSGLAEIKIELRVFLPGYDNIVVYVQTTKISGSLSPFIYGIVVKGRGVVVDFNNYNLEECRKKLNESVKEFNYIK